MNIVCKKTCGDARLYLVSDLTVSVISGTMCTEPVSKLVCRLLKKPKTTGTLSLYCETFH